MLKKLLLLFCLFINAFAFSQTEESVLILPESSANGFYDISRDKTDVVINNIKKTDFYLFRTLLSEEEDDITSETLANEYFFKNFTLLKKSPVIVIKTSNKKYDENLTIKSINSNILINNFYDIYGKNPKKYNFFLVGRDNKHYEINMTEFEKNRQENFSTDYYDTDYILAFVPFAKNVSITTSSTLYAYKDNLNYLINFSDFNLKEMPRTKLVLLSTSKRKQLSNNIYADLKAPKFFIEIKNMDLNKDNLYLFNVDIKSLTWIDNDSDLTIKIGKERTLVLSNYIKNTNKIYFCEYENCISRFMTFKELIKE